MGLWGSLSMPAQGASCPAGMGLRVSPAAPFYVLTG